MKPERTPQEKFEYTRKIFNGFLIGLVCTSVFSNLFTILCELTELLEGQNSLRIALYILLAFLTLFFIAAALILFVRLKKTAKTMISDIEEKQPDGGQDEDL